MASGTIIGIKVAKVSVTFDNGWGLVPFSSVPAGLTLTAYADDCWVLVRDSSNGIRLLAVSTQSGSVVAQSGTKNVTLYIL